MNSLFEYSDRLNAPFECFLFDTRIHSFPIRSHWHYFVEILYMLEGTAIINCDDDTYVLEEGDMTLFLPQAIHSIYTATEQPLVYYVMKFDLNQLAPSGNALSTTFPGLILYHFLIWRRVIPMLRNIFQSDVNRLSHCRNLFLL